MSPQRSPVVVAGMHRSGTSLVAATLASLGVDMGGRQLAADRNNPRGYFEDLEFFALQREMLHDAAADGDGGHRDWGWTESEGLERGRFDAFRERARSLVAERDEAARRAGTAWGWKDPRTTLALDFWDGLVPGAAYVLVYRHPWEVADSMQRLGAEVFLRRPDYAWRIWAFYNRHLLDFHLRAGGRSLLVSTDAVRREPARFLALLRDRLGLDSAGARAEDVFAPELLQSTAPDDPLVALAAATHPECARLLADLDGAADLPGSGTWSDRPLRPRLSATVAPRLAVVIPCYDQGELLVEAVASVERSIAEPCELVVVNDGSREARTLEILAVLRQAGYRIVDQANAGLAAARNRGVELSHAPCLLPLDADNRLRPGFVAAALAVFDARPEVGVAYGDRYDFGLRNGTVDVPPFDLDSILPFNFIDACALLRREVWSACGGYDPGMPAPGWEDWDLWIGAAERGWQFHHLPGEAFDYRVRPASMLSVFADEETRRGMMSYVIAKHRDLYWRRLPEVLVAAQRSAGELFRVAREHERFHAATSAALRSQEERLEAAAAENLALRAERSTLAAEHLALRAQRETWERDLAALSAELERWRERVASMEGTRAWRMRRWLVRLKRALNQRAADSGRD
jgi:GT2 family glycosyltransferase